MDDGLEACQAAIGYHFADRRLLVQALTHASSADHRLESNERLEFLGDAILGAIVCQRLYHRYPESLEGELTAIKSVVVSRKTCVEVSETMGIDEFLILGKGVLHPSKEVPDSILADVFESLVGAIYLDAGFDICREFLLPWIDPMIEAAVEGIGGANYKSQLQHWTQRTYQATPTYRMVDQRGPDHAKQFCVAVEILGRRYSSAWGKSKKMAEQAAARKAITELETEQVEDALEPMPSEPRPKAPAPMEFSINPGQ